jgi:plastocyanin
MRPTQVCRVIVALAALILPVAAMVTVAHASPPPSTTWRVQVGSESADMAVAGMRFLPGDITVDAGDKVTWVAKSAEIHTVTFLAGGTPRTSLPEFNPADGKQVTKRGGSVYDSAKYFNSGILTTVHTGEDAGPLPPVPYVQRYSLTFPKAGTFTYYCLVHGVMMVGVVHVQPAATPYPYTRKQYNDQIRIQRAGLRAMGNQVRQDLTQRSTKHKVMMGDNGAVAVMRFIRRTVVIDRGQAVWFKNIGTVEPHTVTFGKEPPPPALFAPSGNPNRYAGGNLNSGLMPPHSTFKVTFTKTGTYRYVCGLHDFMGMVGKVIVRR